MKSTWMRPSQKPRPRRRLQSDLQPEMNRKLRFTGSVAALSLLLPTMFAFAAGSPALKAGVFEPPRQAPSFSLQGSHGGELKLSSYRGKIVLLGFGFTSCP